MKKAYKILAIILVTLLLLTTGGYLTYSCVFDPFREHVDNLERTLPLDTILTKEQALEDLEYLAECLENFHPAYIDGSDDLVQAVADQYQIEIQNRKDEVSVVELWRAASRITAKMKGGHCSVEVNSKGRFISDITDYKKYTLLQIDGISVSDLYKTFLKQFSYELETYANYMFKDHDLLVTETYLQFLGINTADGVDFKFKTTEGEKTFHYDFVNLDQVIGYKLPENNSFVYYDIDEVGSVGIFTLTSSKCNDTYLDVLEQFFAEVKEKNIQNVVVDLSSNSGGTTAVIKAFLEYIDVDDYCEYRDKALRYGPWLKHVGEGIITNRKKEQVFKGSLYVLTSTQTYSSAMSFALVISDNKIGTVVGEVPGNMPTCHTDHNNGNYQMANSKLYFRIPWKKNYRPDSMKDDQPLIPDYEVNRSEALDKVYELIELNK